LWNSFFNACLAKDELSLEKLLPSFAFGDRLSVRSFGQGSSISNYIFEPVGVALPREDDGGVKAYRFVDLPVTFGVPRVGVQVQVSSTGFGVSKTKAGVGELVDETAYWPCHHDNISQLAQEITAGTGAARERVQALLNWFADGENIRFDGTVVGSRYGVPKVLKQGFGHCWDYSDLFITLARSIGVPCRQVYGWLYGQSGHVWVEVLTSEGWRAVDPTAGMGCDSRYIPLFTSENGAVDFVYTSMPRIKVVEGR
ncbi:MAG: transglutaminase-like domain-containing protein, partial [Pirellulaceae bacterium]